MRKFATALFESRGFRCPQHCCSACSVEKDIHKASKGESRAGSERQEKRQMHHHDESDSHKCSEEEGLRS